MKKCKWCEKNVHINKYTSEVYDCCSEHFQIVKHDFNLKCSTFFSYRHLFNIGYSLCDIRKIQALGVLKKIRLKFISVNFSEECQCVDDLQYLDFSKAKAYEIYKQITKADTVESYNYFLEEINNIICVKNHDINYWVLRGWTLSQAKIKLKHFFQQGVVATNKKRESDSDYDKWWKTTRMPGALTPKTCVSNQSKTEIKILELLKLKYKVLFNFYSPCVNKELKQIYQKHNFCHDFFVNDKYIIEYNGGYWHKDYITFPTKFSKEEYLIEIKKAHNCVYEVNREKPVKYIILWENDFHDDINKIITFLESVFNDNSDQNFYSSREYDYELFRDYCYFIESQNSQDKIFMKIASEISLLSHCQKKQVGAIAVKDGRIVSTGINGTISSHINCSDKWKETFFNSSINMSYEDWIHSEQWKILHREWSHYNEVHAEVSLVMNALKNNLNIKDCIIYVTTEPCEDCSKLLASSGVKEIVYKDKYNRAKDDTIIMLNSSGIILRQI